MSERIVTDSNGRKYITTEPLLHPKIGCVQHDCNKCKARDAELRRLEAELVCHKAALESTLVVGGQLISAKTELLEEMKWIAVRCPAEILQQEPHMVHWEAAYDAGACARAAIQKHGGQA